MNVIHSIAIEFWNTLCEMSPYLLFGFLMAGILSIWITPELVEKHLGSHGLVPILKAAIFGIPLPLCSCGVIPVAASLRQHGASKAATLAFLLSTPQTGVDSIFVTYSLLGPVFAVFRPIVALLTGIAGGISLSEIEKSSNTASQVKGSITVCKDSCCKISKKGNRLREAINYGFSTLTADIAKPILIGLIIAASISALVPDNFFSILLGTGLGPKIVMMLAGIPVYVCATASVPVAAALIAKGITPGAAIVFLMTGPATNAAAITTIWKIMDKRTGIVYLITVAVSSLASGVLFDWFFFAENTTVHTSSHWMMPMELKIFFSVALLTILIRSIFIKHKLQAPKSNTKEPLEKATVIVNGMHCSQCIHSITRAIMELPEIQDVQISLEQKKVQISGTNLDENILFNKINQLGYAVERKEDIYNTGEFS
ncbi:MAG: SO_0444 family Cu/Zn efflux transporter [Candidatus Theseobacter exili]|nr:SO_0444 family Cu/Zn efflux transporter [Candidatus Theseobacter exili]